MTKKELIEIIEPMPDDAQVDVEFRELTIHDMIKGYKAPNIQTYAYVDLNKIVIFKQKTEYLE